MGVEALHDLPAAHVEAEQEHGQHLEEPSRVEQVAVAEKGACYVGLQPQPVAALHGVHAGAGFKEAQALPNVHAGNLKGRARVQPAAGQHHQHVLEHGQQEQPGGPDEQRPFAHPAEQEQDEAAGGVRGQDVARPE